ncbi:MAG: hypothetical protein OXE57_02305, partial [Alphaproteobacteria bacterium]|nr:hypothetical protein [Alphaproteobacteria bacterium]
MAPPANLAAAPGDGKLTVTWTTPAAVTAAPSNYRPLIRWRAQNTSDWLNPAATGDPASNGLSIGGGSLVSSYEITGLTNGRAYEVEIRYVRLNPFAISSWASTTGRPYVPVVTLSATPTTVTEGASVTVRASLSAPLSSTVTIPVSVARNTSESGDHGTLSSIAINAGSTAGTATIATNQDTDADDETFTLTLGSSLP